MTSNIDPTLPAGSPKSYTEDIRNNFAAAKAEIEELQSQIAAMGQGVIDGSEVAAGHVGEFLYVTRLTANAVTLTSNTPIDVISFNLPPGDWHLQGSVSTSGSSSNITDISVWLSQTSATRPTFDQSITFTMNEINFGTGGQSGVDTRTQLNTGTIRLLISQATTIYLTAAITFGSGTCLAAGIITARRVR